jgi:hypothetical protein
MTPKDCVVTATWLANSGYTNMAIQKCEEALRADEFYAPAHWSRCFLKLLQGDYSAWADYKWYDDPAYSVQKGWFKRRVNKPLWDGMPLNGKRIYLYCDEGFGDYFQFLRYVKLIKDRGGYTVVACYPLTEELTKTCPGVDEIVPDQTQVDFDVHCPLMLAPRFFDIETYVPAPVPYLSAPPTTNEHLRLYLSLAAQPSIGCVWRGNPKHSNDTDRSISPELMRRLKTDRLLVSLQHGCYEDGFLNLGVMLQDWTDTAQAVSKMDLIITVDTSVAHLAGAMGKECWLLLPKIPDWRWGLDKTHTPWYPSLRLFRKETSWEALIDRISALL